MYVRVIRSPWFQNTKIHESWQTTGGEKKSLYYVIHSTEEYTGQMFNGNRRANIKNEISLLLPTVGTNTPTTTPKTHDNTEDIQI